MWVTINEVMMIYQGYGTCEIIAPSLGLKKHKYLAVRNVLISHAKAYHLHRRKYYEDQKGKTWNVPSSSKDYHIHSHKTATFSRLAYNCTIDYQY